jgi:hypothetical protein
VALAILLVVVDVALDEPLRRVMEGKLNERLDGYTVAIGELDFHVLGGSLHLHDVLVTQDANPDPPVARIARLGTGIHWRALLRARVVADVEFQEPVLHINRAHLQAEAADEVPARKRGWQAALQALYPFEINRFAVYGGALTYLDREGTEPLDLTDVTFEAENIRNIQVADRTYPSSLWLEAVVFGAGKLRLDGHADFLATPHVGLKGSLVLEGVPLGRLLPVAGRFNVQVPQGVLSARGLVEYAPTIRQVDLEELRIEALRLDYVHAAETARRERQRVRKAARAAEAVTNEPDTVVRVRHAVITGTIGFVNEAAKPPYRLFLENARIEAEHLSSHGAERPAVITVRGLFMSSGTTVASATFRPGDKGPDFDLAVRIDGTQVRSMNDLLRAHGGFDVVDGRFSLVSEIGVRDREIRGYVKPLFQDLDVYDRRQDRHKNVFRKLYEGIVGGIAKILENRPREEVATKADLWGRLENPESSTWQIIVGLIQNAFFKAILPSFESQVRVTSRRGGSSAR